LTTDAHRRSEADARELQEGFECGLHLANYDDVKVGDVLEVFETREVERTSLDEPARYSEAGGAVGPPSRSRGRYCTSGIAPSWPEIRPRRVETAVRAISRIG